MRLRIFSYTFHSVGRYRGSWIRGKGVSYPVTRVIGDLKDKKHLSCR